MKSLLATILCTTTTHSPLQTAAAGALIASLVAACSSANDASTDGGDASDGQSGADAAAVGTGGNSADGSNLIDGPTPTDGALGSTEGGNQASTLAVNLGTAVGYAILAESAISNVSTSAITGSVGLSPAAASYITGFPLTPDSTTEFSTTPQITGKVYASDYATPTPSNLTMAVSDMLTAFTDAAGRAPTVTELGAGNIGGMTLDPGVYKWGTGLLIPTNVTLTGSATAVWIFQIAKDLTVSNGTSVVLAGGALPKNVFWQVAGLAVLGTTSQFEGVILSQTSVTMQTGASIAGRLFAQTAVSIQASTIVQPSP